jgi:hypothetical protein
VSQNVVTGTPATAVDGAGCGNHTLLGNQLAPIALFVYSRPEHTRRTIESLKRNHYADRSDLFVFADAPRSQGIAAAVHDVRKLIRGTEGFKSITIVEREHNFGLSKSIVTGVSELCERFGRAIVVEDDVLTAPDFLTFINLALNRYQQDSRVFSVGGFNLPMSVPPDYPYDAFFSYRFLCWGWGTWKDRWQKADGSVRDFPEFVASRDRQVRFNRGGNDLSDMLARHVAGKIDSWDVVYAYTHSKHDAVALLPVASKVYNIGMDGSGIHCRRASLKQNPLQSSCKDVFQFPDSSELHPHFVAETQRRLHRSLSRRLIRMVLDRVGAK